MKKILFIFLLLLPAFIDAESFVVSDIPLPKTYVQNLDPYECDDACMEDFLQKEMIFSFLAHADKKLDNKELNDIRSMNIAIFNLGAFNAGGKLKIALILPYKKIGKYASTTTNAAFAYLMTKSNPFTLKSYRIESENSEDIQNALSAIKADGFEYVIAPLTQKGANNIIELNPSLNIYFPTINKKDINVSSSYYTFGGIDYQAQSKLLLKEAVSPLIIFSDKSTTGKKLALFQKEEFLHPSKSIEEDVEENGVFGSFFHTQSQGESIDEEALQTDDENLTQREVLEFYISRRTTNLEKQLKENENIINGSFMLNTPIIKSGMIMSQLTLYDTNATNLLSTQINYDPLLLSMTQYRDREKMIIANSIIQNNKLLIDTNALLGNDIVYDWINYTTTVGIDYFYNQITGEAREYEIKIKDKQMAYEIELLRPGRTKFFKYIPKPPQDNELEEGE